ncbi:MAG: hypothetical protein KGD64_03805 [Candidatus Heimdallarchaeota archaeon]|nr:hypothetical protein [Candidatus Heimdallarchaeota archaeon]
MIKYKQSRKITSIMITVLLLLSFTESSIIHNTVVAETSTNQSPPILNYEKDNWWLTELELLSDTSTDFSLHPDIAIDSNDNIHVVWDDGTDDLLSSGTDTDVFYKIYDSITETWSVTELVSSESTSASSEACLDVDSLGNVHVCWTDTTDYLGSGIDWDVFYKMRTPTGVWSTTTVVSTLSTAHSDNMDLAIDSDDNVHVVYKDNTDILGADSDDDIFYQWLNSSLSSWSASILVTSESISASDYPSIAIDPLSDTPYIAWHDITDLVSSGTDFDIFSRSYNHSSSSFSSVLLISEESSAHSYSPTIEFNSKGVPCVVWYDLANMLGSGVDQDIFYKYLNTVSNEWVGIEVVSSDSNLHSYRPHCVIDKEDRVYVIWEDYAELLGSGSDLDLFFKIKDPNVDSWSEIRLVTSLSDNFASSVKLAVDGNGFVSSVWYDYANLLSAGIDADIFYKKFVGTPSIPILLTIMPNPTSEENVTLNWKYNTYVSSYSLYRSKSHFTSASIGSMDPIVTLSSNNFNDTLNETGLYYYGVVALNEYGPSSLSNVESVQVVEDGISDGFLGFLSSIGIWEILTIAGVIILSQVLISLLISSIVKGGSKGGKNKGTTKKKK